MSETACLESVAIVLVTISASPPATYPLETAARLANLHPEILRYYCRLGLLGAERTAPEPEPTFDDDALFELRRFEQYRRHHRIDRTTLRLIGGLRREVEQLRAELRFLRGP